MNTKMHLMISDGTYPYCIDIDLESLSASLDQEFMYILECLENILHPLLELIS